MKKRQWMYISKFIQKKMKRVRGMDERSKRLTQNEEKNQSQ